MFGKVIRVEESRVSWGYASHPIGMEPQRSPIFGGCPLFMPTHDQIRRGNICGGACFQEVSHALYSKGAWPYPI